MKTETALSIIDCIKALEARGIRTSIHNVDSAEIVTARDIIANMVLQSKEWDGLLFIDSDMAFRPDLILKLVDSNSEVAAAACPRRQLNLQRFAAATSEHGNIARALAHASDFTVNLDWSGKPTKVQIQDGFVRAAAVGMAIALIAKNALTALVDANLVEVRRDLSSAGAQPCYSFFEIAAPEGHRLGEDYSFCHRWTAQLKRELLVCVDEQVTHLGLYPFRARMADLSAT